MPASPGARKVVDVFQRMQERWRERATDVRPARIVGRNEDGSAQLMRLDGECVSRGGQGGYMGEVVTDLPALLNRSGTSGVPLQTGAGTAHSLWIERIDPSELVAGSTMTVSIFGGGFSETTVFEFLRPESDEINDDITIESLTLVSSAQVDVLLAISLTADLFVTPADIAFDDPEVPL